MIASIIGRAFLQAYNHQYKCNMQAKDFFQEIFIPLFFDHPVYLMKGGNAPLDNPKIKRGKPPDAAERATRIAKTIELIESNPAGSSAIGYPSADLEATTSGQVSNMDLHITPEEVYFSWIGGALGIGVNGGFSLFFNHPQILMHTFYGWQVYRQLIENTPGMKGNQIETWNGLWLADFYEAQAPQQHQFRNLDALEISGQVTQLTTQSWVGLLFAMAKYLPEQQLVGYVYNLGQTNTTLGFVPFKLYEIDRPMQLYKKYFGETQFTRDTKQIKQIFSSNYGIYAACANGNVGIKAIEPKALKVFMPHAHGKSKFYKFSDDAENQIIFQTFLTWVYAMINNETLIDMAEAFAKILTAFESGAEKAKKDRSNLTVQLLDSTSRKKFIDALVPVVAKADSAETEKIDQLVNEINKMPAENFSYFVTLVRFKYAVINK